MGLFSWCCIAFSVLVIVSYDFIFGAYCVVRKMMSDVCAHRESDERAQKMYSMLFIKKNEWGI